MIIIMIMSSLVILDVIWREMQKHYLCGSWWWDTQEQRFSSSKLEDWLQTWELTDNWTWSVVCSWACVGRYWWLPFLKSLWLMTSWTKLFLQRGSADPNFVALVESPAEKSTSSNPRSLLYALSQTTMSVYLLLAMCATSVCPAFRASTLLRYAWEMDTNMKIWIDYDRLW